MAQAVVSAKKALSPLPGLHVCGPGSCDDQPELRLFTARIWQRADYLDSQTTIALMFPVELYFLKWDPR